MDSLPSWARRKILDGFVRRWTRAQCRARDFPLSDREDVLLASELLAAGKIGECEHGDLVSIVEQVVLLEMDQMERRVGSWQEFLAKTLSWDASELLPKQAITYAHFAAAEECLREGSPASALAWASRAPLSLHLIGPSERTITWPQVHHVRALAALLNGDDELAKEQIQRAIDGVLRPELKLDTRYLQDLEGLKAEILRPRHQRGPASTPSETLEGELVLVRIRAKAAATFTGYWQLGRKQSKTRFGDLEVRTAKVMLKPMKQALRRTRDVELSKQKFEEMALAELGPRVTMSHLRKVRRAVVDALHEVTGPKAATLPRGSRGGIVFHGKYLLEAGVTDIRTRSS